MGPPNVWIDVVLTIAAILTAIGVVWVSIKAAHKVIKRANQFFDDWYGESGDGNHVERPGVLHRIGDMEVELAKNTMVHQRIEKDVAAGFKAAEGEREAIAKKVNDIEEFVSSELQTNHGSSIKDKVSATSDTVGDIKSLVDALSLQVEQEVLERKHWTDSYQDDQVTEHHEWAHVFSAIRSMIGMPPEDQLRVWDEITKNQILNRDAPEQ